MKATPDLAKDDTIAVEDAEWADPRNWHGGRLNLYFSRRDKRAFVPKRGTVVGGATVNFARATGILYVVGILLFGVLVYALNQGQGR